MSKLIIYYMPLMIPIYSEYFVNQKSTREFLQKKGEGDPLLAREIKTGFKGLQLDSYLLKPLLRINEYHKTSQYDTQRNS